MDAPQEILAVLSAELRRTLRSGRVVALLLLYGLFSLLVLLVVGFLSRKLQAQLDSAVLQGADPEAMQRSLDAARQQVLGFVFNGDATAVESLARLPVVLLVTFRITLIFLPLYVALMGFDQISGELGPKAIRFLTVRARRSSILLGKFLGQASLLLGLVLLVDLAIFVEAKLSSPSFTLGLAAVTLLRFWLAATVFSLAYLALSTLCSSLFRLPAVSLISNVLALFVFWVLDLVGMFFRGRAEDLDVGTGHSVGSYVSYLSPSHYAGDLLHPSAARYALSTGAYAAFACVFLLLAYAALRRRDV